MDWYRRRGGAADEPVLSATDLVIAKLLSFQHHHCDFAWALPMVRALREQVDWPQVRRRTSSSPFAEAFLLPAGRDWTGRRRCR